ncbi:MFS transporter [Saccharopolyspora sp. NPDC003752]
MTSSPPADDSLTAPRQVAGSDRKLRHPLLVLILLVLINEVFAFEFTVVMPGLPDMAAVFGSAHISLVMSVPLLFAAVIVPLLAKWGDIHGKKRALLIGSLSFVVGTLVCALAQSYPLFLVGRGLQGLGLVGPVITYGMMRDLLPPRWVPIAIGGMGVGLGVSGVVGPFVGGALIDSVGFRAAFWFLLGYIVVTGLLVLVFVPESPVRIAQRLDLIGAALLGFGVVGLVAAATIPGWRLPAVVLGIVLLVLFVLVERRKSQPLISMTLLARPAVAMTLASATAIGFLVGAQAVLMPLLLRNPTGLGLSAMQYAVSFAMVSGVCNALFGFLAGFVCRWANPRAALLTSCVGWTLAMALIASGFVDERWKVAVMAALLGVGQGSFFAAAANLIVEAVPAKVQGVTASMKFTVEQVAGSIAAAVGGAVIAADVVRIEPSTGAVVYGLTGFRNAFLILTAVAVVGLVLTLLMRHGRQPATGGVQPDSADR